MATSMNFGPEWMRKGPNSKNSGKETTSATPSAATSPGTGPIAGSAAPSVGNGGGASKRNGGPGGLANLSGPTPVVSPPVSSPGGFSFAAAAAAATAQNSERNGATPHSSSAFDNDGSAGLLNGGSAALAKDKVTREKLLSLYSSDRTSKTPSAEPFPIDAAPGGNAGAGAGPERSTSTSRRKNGTDRRPSAFAEFGAVGGGPLSPGLAGNEPRGLNARSTSGSSSGGFGSAGLSNWDKAEKERPGLFQRASSGALAGVNTNSGSRPLSPSVSRDRFSGIQGGVLSGVAPPARKRMDSSDGGAGAIGSTRTVKATQDEASIPPTTNGANSAGSWGRSAQNAIGQPGAIGGAVGGFSDAFSSNRVRGRNTSAAHETVTSPTTATPIATAPEASQPIVPSGNPEGLSISARFARHKDRLPGEGPIGPPSDGSIGFGKSSGFDRRRERQISQAKPVSSLQSSHRGDAGSAAPAHEANPNERPSAQAQDSINQNAGAAEHTLGSDEQDLAQHASAVLGSLKLDEDDNPGLHASSALAGEGQSNASDRLGNSAADDFLRGGDARQHFDQSHQQHNNQNHNVQPAMSAAPWSPETSMWLYRDMAGNVQGPFSSLMMQDWYSQQYFADDLLIKRQEDADFKPLAQVVAAVGNALQPFVIPPSNWLHSPAPPRPAFDTNLGGEQQSRFSDAFDSNRSWSGQAGRQQQQQQQQQGWPAQLALGGLGNGGPAPASPFGRSDLFAGGQGGLRNQDDLMSIIRERELQEQRQAAAAAASRGPGGMSLGQLDGFGGGLGRGGWGAESAMSPSHWGGIGHGGLGQFGDVGLSAHQSPLVGDRPVYDNFNHQQRQAFEQSGSPWTNKASLAPRSQFDSALGGGVRPMQGQWGEQQAPWNYSATTPDVTNRQMDFSEGILRNEALKNADPIGTPRRARSPAPQSDIGSVSGGFADQKAEQHRSFEDAFPAPAAQNDQAQSEALPATTPAITAAEEGKAPAQPKVEIGADATAKTATPQKKLSKKEAQKAAAAAAKEASQQAKAVDSEIPPPEAFTASEPRPEELWPQSPKAVEFASEPELSGMPALTLSNKSAKDVKREQRSALQRPASEATRSVPGSGDAASRAAAARPTGASNVRVVSQEQFRRGKDADNNLTSTQAPLSDWLNDGSAATDSPAPASRPAPWAAKEDSTPSSGPSLREIQEAEAKRAEAKRAAEKAAARARMAASPSAAEELPTTLSWGLASAPASKSSNNASADAAASAGPAAPAWNAGKTAPKKTLMEIQEEERKRAEKLKAQQAAQAIALRKGYADSASRSTSATNLPGAVVAPISGPTSAAGGGAWSVVGASGKPTTPSGGNTSAAAVGVGSATASPLATTVRPSLSTTARAASGAIPSASTGGSAWSVVGATKPATAAPASPSPASRVVSSTNIPTSSVLSSSAAAASKSRSVSNDPNAPSPEFIRYCKDNLQGLTIKTDDFIDMLLQFPLDPSADVIEIIADTVYANSSTLDGRRFANDFVSKRKLDVQGRTTATGGGSGSSGVSRWGSASAGAGMGSFGSGIKSNSSATAAGVVGGASPFSAKTLGGGGDPFKNQPATRTAGGGGGGAEGFKVVKGKGGKKRP